tara:strand:- start:335 stop:649 length:315 start_codon:yes stop_codon:yes gene_type:complete
MTNESEIKKGKTTFASSYPEPLVDEIDQDSLCAVIEPEFFIVDLYRLDNTEGYTQEECDRLNYEFSKKWSEGEYDHLRKLYPYAQSEFIMQIAEKEFTEEVSSR